MFSHKRFSAALALIAVVGLGACANDPTGLKTVVTRPNGLTQPLQKCLKQGGEQADISALRLRGSGEHVMAPARVVDCAQ